MKLKYPKATSIEFASPAAMALWHHPKFDKLRRLAAEADIDDVLLDPKVQEAIQGGGLPGNPLFDKLLFTVVFEQLGAPKASSMARQLVEFWVAAAALVEIGEMKIH
jgi:hypothetical protein